MIKIDGTASMYMTKNCIIYKKKIFLFRMASITFLLITFEQELILL